MTLTALKTYRLCVACKTLKNVSLVVAARWVRQADKKILMNETEYEIYMSFLTLLQYTVEYQLDVILMV